MFHIYTHTNKARDKKNEEEKVYIIVRETHKIGDKVGDLNDEVKLSCLLAANRYENIVKKLWDAHKIVMKTRRWSFDLTEYYIRSFLEDLAALAAHERQMAYGNCNPSHSDQTRSPLLLHLPLPNVVAVQITQYTIN